MLNWFRELTLVPVIVVLMVVGAFVNPVFFTPSNLINVAEGGAALGMVVVAESLILLTGKFDISLQGTFGLAPLLGAWLIAPKASEGLGTEFSPWIGLVVVCLGGPRRRHVQRHPRHQGELQRLHLHAGHEHPSDRSAARLAWRPDVYNLPEVFIYLGAESWFGLPVAVWVTVATFVAAALFLRYHRIGRAMYAIGGNLEAARAAGIQVDRIRIGVFMVASVLAAVGGLMQAGRVTAVTAGQGSNLIFGGVRRGGDRRHLARRRPGPDGRRADRRDPAVAGHQHPHPLQHQLDLDRRGRRRDHPDRAGPGQAHRHRAR